jgi:hypothetical protein
MRGFEWLPYRWWRNGNVLLALGFVVAMLVGLLYTNFEIIAGEHGTRAPHLKRRVVASPKPRVEELRDSLLATPAFRDALVASAPSLARLIDKDAPASLYRGELKTRVNHLIDSAIALIYPNYITASQYSAVAATGQALLATAAKMRVGLDTIAEIRLARNNRKALTEDLAKTGLVMDSAKSIQVALHMTAQLAGQIGGDFTIEPLDVQDRAVTSDEPVSWQFRVTPQRAGTLHLVAMVAERTEGVGKTSEYGALKRITLVVPVESNWPWTTVQFVRANAILLTTGGSFLGWMIGFVAGSRKKTGDSGLVKDWMTK